MNVMEMHSVKGDARHSWWSYRPCVLFFIHPIKISRWKLDICTTTLWRYLNSELGHLGYFNSTISYRRKLEETLPLLSWPPNLATVSRSSNLAILIPDKLPNQFQKKRYQNNQNSVLWTSMKRKWGDVR